MLGCSHHPRVAHNKCFNSKKQWQISYSVVHACLRCLTMLLQTTAASANSAPRKASHLISNPSFTS
jgi:hypothetical protein